MLARTWMSATSLSRSPSGPPSRLASLRHIIVIERNDNHHNHHQLIVRPSTYTP